MHHFTSTAIALLAFAASASSSPASQRDPQVEPAGHCRCAHQSEACIGKGRCVEVDDHGWNVTHEKVCVPPVRFPWQKGGSGLTLFSWLKVRKKNACEKHCCGCDGRPACYGCPTLCCRDPLSCCRPWGCKVICVRDLEKQETTKKVCEYKWSIRRLPPCCPCKCHRCRGRTAQPMGYAPSSSSQATPNLRVVGLE